MALDPSAIASAVQKEIERQQAAVVYDDLSADELEKVVAQLTEKLSMCQEALAKRGGDGAAAAKAPPARKAAKSSGKFEHALDLGMAWKGEWFPYAFGPFIQSFGGVDGSGVWWRSRRGSCAVHRVGKDSQGDSFG